MCIRRREAGDQPLIYGKVTVAFFAEGTCFESRPEFFFLSFLHTDQNITLRSAVTFLSYALSNCAVILPSVLQRLMHCFSLLQALVYRDGGNLVSGSLDALVQHMVPTADYYPDRAYLFAFLLSSRLFIKPHELLGEVCALCDSQQKLGEKQVVAKVSSLDGGYEGSSYINRNF
jgi:hypothetical protein